jgi:hypothetical protein
LTIYTNVQSGLQRSKNESKETVSLKKPSITENTTTESLSRVKEARSTREEKLKFLSISCTTYPEGPNSWIWTTFTRGPAGNS